MTNTSRHDAVRRSYVNLEQVYGAGTGRSAGYKPRETDNTTIQLVPVIPAGDYTLEIKAAHYVRRGRHDARLRLLMQVGLGPRTFQPVVIDLQIEHPDDAVCRRDHQDYVSLLFCLGMPDIERAADLVGYDFRATVGRRQASAAHATQNYFAEFHEGTHLPEHLRDAADGDAAKAAAGYVPMPPGDYSLEIVESDYVENGRGNGMVAKLLCQVVGGEYDGRPYYINLNLEHANEEAQDIAQRDFLSLREAIGIHRPGNTVELHDRPFKVRIGTKPRKDTGQPENVIREYYAADDNAPEQAPAVITGRRERPWAALRKSDRRGPDAHPWSLSHDDLAGLVGRGAGHQYGAL